MATISDPIRHGHPPGGVAWGDRGVIADGSPIPDARKPSRAERVPARGAQPPVPPAAHYTIAAVDIVGFGDRRRNGASQLRVRRGLYGALRESFGAAGIPWERCRREDRGDGALILAPGDLPKGPFADRLPAALADALAAHNRRHPAKEQIRLRLALHAGEVFHDEHGVTSTSLNHTFRMLDAETFKSLFAQSAGVLGVISSAWFYDEVIWQSDWGEADSYNRVEVTNKETTTATWIRVVGQRSASATAVAAVIT